MIPVLASRAPSAAASQFSRSCVRLLVLSAVPRPRHPALASRRASPEMTTTPTDNWLAQESIALVDNAPLFSAGECDHAVTFWQIMVDSTPELSARSALECEEHWSRRIELRIEEWTQANERVGPAPSVLKDGLDSTTAGTQGGSRASPLPCGSPSLRRAASKSTLAARRDTLRRPKAASTSWPCRLQVQSLSACDPQKDQQRHSSSASRIPHKSSLAQGPSFLRFRWLLALGWAWQTRVAPSSNCP